MSHLALATLVLASGICYTDSVRRTIVTVARYGEISGHSNSSYQVKDSQTDLRTFKQISGRASSKMFKSGDFPNAAVEKFKASCDWVDLLSRRAWSARRRDSDPCRAKKTFAKKVCSAAAASGIALVIAVYCLSLFRKHKRSQIQNGSIRAATEGGSEREAEMTPWKSGKWINDYRNDGEDASVERAIEDDIEDEVDYCMQATMAKTLGGREGFGAGISLFAPDVLGSLSESPDENEDEDISLRHTLWRRIAAFCSFWGALVGFIILHVADLTCRTLSKNTITDRMEYSIVTILLMSGVFSILIGHSVAYYNEGTGGMKEIWDIKFLLKLSVSSVCFNFESMLRFVAIDVGLQADMIMVISRLSTVLLAIIMAVLLKRKQDKVQGMLLINLVVCVYLFSSLKASLVQPKTEAAAIEKSGAPGSQVGTSTLLGVLAATGAMLLGVTGEISQTVVLLWNEEKPVYIMKTAQDLPGTALFLAMCIGNADVRRNGFFYGWNRWCFVIMVLFLGKLWCAFIILNALGPVVKQVASVAAIVLQYFVVMILFQDKVENRFDANVFLCVVLLSLGVTCYTIETQARLKRKQTKKI